MNSNLESQKQDSRSVETVENRRATDRIVEAREQFRKVKGVYPSVIQVGTELFKRAFPNVLMPHHGSAIESTLVMPRPDVCGKWGLVVIKPPELRNGKTQTAA